MRISSMLCFAFIFISTQATAQTKTYSITDFGAKGDGKTINTTAINEAIAACNKAGGGTVLVPSGVFISGTILLKSNVDLHLEAGAILEASKDTSDYLRLESLLFREGYNRRGLIYALECKNVSISGRGEIFGNGMYFMYGPDKPNLGGGYSRKMTRQGEDFLSPKALSQDGPAAHGYRPGLMITFDHCERVSMTDIYLHDSPEWTVRIAECDDVNVRGVSIINNQLIPNSDGIHCTTSRNIRISDCHISVGDDAIIVTGFIEEPEKGIAHSEMPMGNLTGYSENVTVTNCTLSSRSACIRVGYGKQPIRNLVFSNLVMYASNRGIGVFSRSRSNIENVLFSNITIHTSIIQGFWWGKGEPIHVSAIRDEAGGDAGRINNIRFHNIIAESETGIVVWGDAYSPIENILFDQVQLTVRNGKNTLTYGGNIDLEPAFPIDSGVFKHDIPGLFAQHVKNLTIRQFEMHWGKSLAPFFTHGIEVRDFSQLLIDGFTGNPASQKTELAAIKLANGSQAVLRNNNSYDGPLRVIRENVKP